MSKLIIGSHVSVAGNDMLVGAVQETIQYQANTFMFYTGAPQNTKRKPISEFKVDDANRLMKQHGIDAKNVIVHAPYIINLANSIDDRIMEITTQFLYEEIQRVNKLGFKYLVVHPGSHLGAGLEKGIQQIIYCINQVFAKDKTDVILLLETMAGKGTEIGSRFEELATIVNLVADKNRIGLCLDTCHLHDAGYDLTNFDLIIQKIDVLIGLDYIKAIHINDSKNPRNSHKDRHENIGYGSIGFEHLVNIVHHPKTESMIKILETPWINDLAPYRDEIEMIKTNIFNPKLKEII